MILLTPGPTPLPQRVRDALAQQAIPHRSRPFEAIFASNCRRLAQLHRTRGAVAVLPGSGTTAFEAAALSLTAPGDAVVVGAAGKFGERWAKVFGSLRERAGVRVEVAKRNWGEPVEPEDIDDAITRAGGGACRTVVIVHSETSTATAVDLPALAERVRQRAPDAIVLVDCVGSLAALPIEQDAWGIDVCVGASQKGLSAPAGLGLVSLGPRALDRLNAVEGLTPMSLDLRWHLKDAARGRAPATPPINLHFALAAALDVLDDEGVVGRLASTRKRAHATREAARAMGLRLASVSPSDAVTGVEVPSDPGADAVLRAMLDGFGVAVAGGQEAWKGRVVRLSHMGAITDEDALAGVRALAQSLRRLGAIDANRARAGEEAADAAHAERGAEAGA